MKSATIPFRDKTRDAVRNNMAQIKLITAAGPLLSVPAQTNRVISLLENRHSWGFVPPLVMLAVHNDNEEVAANQFILQDNKLAEYVVVRQKGHNETVGNAISLFRNSFDPNLDPFMAKRKTLFLTRRGGKGKPHFISPFTGGAGTTCGEWTRPVVRHPDGTVTKGFIKAAVAVGFCPVECPFCYLNLAYTDGMDIVLNWKDLAEELYDFIRPKHRPIHGYEIRRHSRGNKT